MNPKIKDFLKQHKRKVIIGMVGFLTALFLLAIATKCEAWSLVCDPQIGVISYDVEVDGVVIAALYPAETNGSILYNIDHLGPGPVVFRLRPWDASGWGADWSLPFDARKPNVAIGAKIVKDTGD